MILHQWFARLGLPLDSTSLRSVSLVVSAPSVLRPLFVMKRVKSRGAYTKSTMPFYFYLARCSDGSLYAGSCVNLKEREKKHNEGKGAKYTRSRRPIKIIYHEEYVTRGEVLRREATVKTWSKIKKEHLVFFYASS